MFWNDLDTLLKLRRGELPATTYLKSASESVRKTMVDQYYKMVEDDTVSKWVHQKLKKENAQLQDRVKEEREGKEDERLRRVRKETVKLSETKL